MEETMTHEFVEMVASNESISSKQKTMTLKGFFISLAVSLIIFLCYLLVFCVFRKKLRSIYEPRTFIQAKNGSQPPVSSNGFITWVVQVFSTKNKMIMQTLGLDAYFFLRFILFVMTLCGALAIPFIVTLIPVHLLGRRKGVKGLDRISILNVDDYQQFLHLAHLILEFICMVAIMLVFNFELKNYFRLRAEYMLSKSNDDISGSCSTILVKEINANSCNERDVARVFNDISKNCYDSKAVKKIWFNRDYTKLHKLVCKRSSILNKLENLELWIVEKSLGIGDALPEDWRNGNKDSAVTGNLWREFMSPENLQKMYGKKGSDLTWLKGEMSRLNAEIYAYQTNEKLSPVSNSCFIQFSNNISTFVASRSLITSDSLGSGVKVYEKVYPADIIWSNLSASTWQRRVTKILSITLNFIFIFGWAVPVAVISIATQVNTMARWMPQIHIAVTSQSASYLMNGVLTPILVSSITSMIPYFFRILSKLKGFPTNTLVEMDVQNYLFLFMFFQLFLIVTISTGLPALLITTLINTSEGAMTLANSLPKSTTFFISYVLASSLTTAGNTLLQSSQLLFAIYYKLFSRTPRQKFRSRYITNTIYWGSVYPLVSNVGSIAIAYALISPVIFLTAIIGLFALYVAFKYRILYCYIPRCIAYGDYYPKAIFQLFAGIYCQQISLLGSFLVQGQISLATIAALIIVATIISHRHLRSIFIDMKTRIPVAERSTDKEAMLTQSPHRRGKVLGSPESGLSNITLADEYTPGKRQRNDAANRLGIGSPGFTTPISSPESQSNGSASPRSPEASSNAIDADTWAKLFDTMSIDFNRLNAGQQEYIANELYEHPDRWLQRPCVWIPNDWKGVGEDQVHEMQHYFTNMRASCDGTEIDNEGNVYISRAPPDFDPREIMKM